MAATYALYCERNTRTFRDRMVEVGGQRIRGYQRWRRRARYAVFV